MEPTVDSWSLPLLVVEKLVSVLKQTRRWRLDGPSLRLVNKRWSRLIDQYIVEVRPHPDRLLVPEDTASLRKFPRLASVDIQPFIFQKAKATMSQASEGNPSDEDTELFAEECDISSVVDVLVQLPQLSHLELGNCIACRGDDRYSSLQRVWTQLECVTSLHIYGNFNPNHYGCSPSNGCWLLQADRFAVPMPLKDLASFVSLFPRRRSLEVFISEADIRSSDDLHLLDEFDELKLQVNGSSQFIASLSKQSAVVGIALHERNPTTLDFLTPFECLESLRMLIESSLLLKDKTTTIVFRRLTSLDLIGGDNCLIPADCFDVFDQLRTLCLCNVSFYGEPLKGKLLNLTSLRLFLCLVQDGCLSFLEDMKNLKDLRFRFIISVVGKPHTHFLNDLRLPQSLICLYSDGVSDCTIACIAKLTQLEVLSVKIVEGATITNLSELENLPALRNLGIFDMIVKNDAHVDEFLSLGFLTRLERLFLLIRPVNETQVREILRKKAPKLIVELGYESFVRFECANYL